MKKQVVLAAALTFILLANGSQRAHASIPPDAASSLKVMVKTGQQAMTLELQISQLDKKRTLISVQDMLGKVWFSDVAWKKETYAKLLNLTGVATGDYLLSIYSQAGEHVQMLHVTSEVIKLYEPASRKDLENGTVLFTGPKQAAKTITRITPDGKNGIAVQLANLKEHPTTVTMYSVGAGPVLVQNIKGKQAYAKKFNLEGMLPGSYFLAIQTKEATICQFFTLSKDGVMFGPAQHSPAKAGAGLN